MINALEWVNANSGLIYLGITIFLLPFIRKMAVVYQEKKHLAGLLTGFANIAEDAAKMVGTGAAANKAVATAYMIDYVARKYPEAISYLKADNEALTAMATKPLNEVIRSQVIAAASEAMLKATDNGR